MESNRITPAGGARRSAGFTLSDVLTVMAVCVLMLAAIGVVTKPE